MPASPEIVIITASSGVIGRALLERLAKHYTGALIVTAAVMTMTEVGRALRFVNVLFGAWLIVAPWVLEGASMTAS